MTIGLRQFKLVASRQCWWLIPLHRQQAVCWDGEGTLQHNILLTPITMRYLVQR